MPMMKLRMYQVDAFSNQVFRGNPAAVVPLDKWLPDYQLQGIATENNLSETAFFIPTTEGKFCMRWFTLTQEVPLCGHATLASAFVIFTALHPSWQSVCFETLSGELGVERRGEIFVLDFPSRLPEPCEPPIDLLQGLTEKPVEIFKTRLDPNYYAVYEREHTIAQIKPNFMLLAKLHPYGVVITAPGEQSDFVSRYFAPSYGIPEDPVTGSTHCALVPYWSKRINKSTLLAKQISKRGGELYCELLGERVAIGGKAVKYFEGDIYL